MKEQNLILNILNFKHPVEKRDFAYYPEKKNGCLPINHYELLLNNEEILPYAKAQKFHQLYTDLKDGYKNFPKLNQLFKFPVNIIKADQITFTNNENPLPEIKQNLFNKFFDLKIRYIAIYLSPFSKNQPDIAKRQYYFHVKEELLNTAFHRRQ